MAYRIIFVGSDGDEWTCGQVESKEDVQPFIEEDRAINGPQYGHYEVKEVTHGTK